MLNPLKALANLNPAKMQEQAAKIQAELALLKFTSTRGRIQVVITGNQVVESVLIDDQNIPELVDVLNDAIRQSQQAAASKLATMSQSLGIGQ